MLVNKNSEYEWNILLYDNQKEVELISFSFKEQKAMVQSYKWNKNFISWLEDKAKKSTYNISLEILDKRTKLN